MPVTLTAKNYKHMIKKAIDKLEEQDAEFCLGICEECKTTPASFIYYGDKHLCGGCLEKLLDKKF